VTIFAVRFRRERLQDLDRVYVEDETVAAPETAPSYEPTA